VDVACFIFGIIALMKGVLPLPWNREVRGPAAYVVGLLLVAILPCTVTTVFIMLLNDDQVQPPPKGELKTESWIILYCFGIIATFLIPASIIALLFATRKAPKQPDDEDDEYNEDDDYDRLRPRR
jgi:uncharacterized membrane protein HdeD (DUF308 family)